MALEEVFYHEAGHAIVAALESESSPLQFVTTIPSGEIRLFRDKETLASCSPRKLRAHGRVAVAGAICAKLGGVDPSAEVKGGDLEHLRTLRRYSKRGLRFDEECRAGAELRLRLHWAAVEDLVNTLRQCGGYIAEAYVEDFLRMAFAKPFRPLLRDLATFERLSEALKDVPEISEEIASGLGGILDAGLLKYRSRAA